MRVKLDSRSDTSVTAYILEVIEGYNVSTEGFSVKFPVLEGVAFVNAMYLYDTADTGEICLSRVT